MAGGGSGKIGYTLQFSHNNAINPLDTTTYYIGVNGLPNIAEGVSRAYIPKSGTIKSCYIHIANGGVLGSGETSTISIRVNNTTDTTVSSVITTNSTVQVFSNTNLSIPISAGDYIELKLVTPSWATNPTSVQFTCVVYIE